MALHRLRPVLFSTNPKDEIDFLKSRGLLSTQQDCPNCSMPMDWKTNLLGGAAAVVP